MAGRFAVVEMQCFTDNAGHYILKELAIVSEEGVGNWVFLPPYDFETLNAKAQQTALWLTTQFHGLAWDSGCELCRSSEYYIQVLRPVFKNLH